MFKKVSSKSVIGSFYRSFGFDISNMKYDLIEWIGDAIEKIGYHTGFDSVEENIDVIDYKIRIPCEAVRIDEVIYKDYTLRKLKTSPPLYEENVIQELVPVVTKDYLTRRDVFGRNIDGIRSTVISQPEYFWYDNPFLKFTFETGEVKLKYIAFPFDEDGFPEIVDTFKYRDAVRYYLMLRCIESGYQHPLISYKDIIQLSEQAIHKARNESRLLSTEDLENFRRQWTDMLFILKQNFNYPV